MFSNRSWSSTEGRLALKLTLFKPHGQNYHQCCSKNHFNSILTKRGKKIMRVFTMHRVIRKADASACKIENHKCETSWILAKAAALSSPLFFIWAQPHTFYVALQINCTFFYLLRSTHTWLCVLADFCIVYRTMVVLCCDSWWLGASVTSAALFWSDTGPTVCRKGSKRNAE